MIHARLAVSAMFLLNGALFGLWASRIPAFVQAFALEPGALGRILLCLAAGAILSFPLAGRLSDRIGAATATRGIAVVYAIALPLLALAPSPLALGALLVLFGAGHGAMDVTMNAWGAEVERALGRPIMPAFHAMWSLGAGLGALSGWAAAAAGLGVGLHFSLGAGLFGAAALTLAAVPWTSNRSAVGAGFALPSRVLVAVGVVALCSSVGEGAMADWSAVFLIEVAGTTEAEAALGYGVYSVVMMAARLGAGRVINRLGAVRAARIAGLTAGAGLLVALLGGTLATGLAGFALVGLGYSVVVPLAFSRAANDPLIPPGRAIAGVATLGYGGMVLGPVAIGAVAQATSLPTAFGLIAVLALGISALAASLRPAA